MRFRPLIISISFAKIFRGFPNHLTKKILLHQHIFTPSSMKALLQKESLFEVPLNHRLQVDVIQIRELQYDFFSKSHVTPNTNFFSEITIK